MSTEYEFFSKDYIKLYMLNDTVNTRAVSFKLFLESEGKETDFLDVRTAGRSVYRFNNFNVSEDATNNCITFRPNVVGCYVYFSIGIAALVKVEIIRNGTNTVAEAFDLQPGTTKIEFQPQGTKKYALKLSFDSTVPEVTAHPSENASNTPEQAAPTINPFETDFTDFSSGIVATNASAPAPSVSTPMPEPSSFEASSVYTAPASSVSAHTEPVVNTYTAPAPRPAPSVSSFGISSASSEEIKEKNRTIDQLDRSNDRLNDDIAELEKKIRELDNKNQDLVDKKKNLTLHLDKLQAEFDKDYSNYSSDVEEISSRYKIDAEILKLYGDKEVTTIEQLLQNAENDIKMIEDQIKVFVEAQERKTAEIENELKIGKKE